MEQVSESFKKAIKSDTREVKGYVEIIYDDKDVNNYSLEIASEQERISLISEIIDKVRRCNKYASLEGNYTELDGSFLLPNYNLKGEKAGYISKDVFSDIKNPVIKISCDDMNFVKSSGLTIYFEDNIAQVFNLIITKDDNTTKNINVVNNSKSIYQVIFEEIVIIKDIQIEIFQMEYSDRRIRIAEVDFGISQVYENNDLVSFTVSEEIDLSMTSTPINDCKIDLNNYDGIFDPVNPVGIVKYLNDSAIISPFIGVLTDDNGVEYIKMGTFYLTNWSNNDNGNVTLNGSDVIYKLKDESLKMDINIFNTNFTSESWNNFLKRIYGYSFDIGTLGINEWNLKYTQDLNLFNNLQWNLVTYYSRYTSKHYIPILNASRDNTIKVKTVSGEILDKLSRKELLDYPKYIINNLITNIEIQTYTDAGIAFLSTSRADVLNTRYVLDGNEVYVWFKLSQYTYSEKSFDTDNSFGFKFSYLVTSGSGKAELIANNHYLIYVKFTGTIGTTFDIKYNGIVYHTNLPSRVDKYNLDSDVGEKLTIDSTKYTISISKEVADFLLNNNFNYTINVNTIGDPSLEVGDTISIETKFGFKDMIITKNSLTFDGGLSGNIEGVGN